MTNKRQLSFTIVAPPKCRKRQMKPQPITTKNQCFATQRHQSPPHSCKPNVPRVQPNVSQPLFSAGIAPVSD
ncbi:hypothetical protein PanWU01x14_113310 [Parasponia andersonii]|uniref:Uncharacterized protein n=1 Tax=Parasponia andersonii TaxID=3476 RepID=A0A2P5CXR4_PARAD|nr:hypothetical protein PanWU01x14_113310 [Parasponia andersonii]